MTTPVVAARELPAYRTHRLRPRHHRFALVIPVINEGTRIQNQLRRIAALEPAVDVIIADGGSTDGSLSSAFLEEQGVTALLVKTGPGRLSAQLRMAFAHCLDQNYDGVITVDGNGKDGLDAIPRFVAKLEEGFGYVQGSRYLPGGRSHNTPWDRKLGGRLIHAPLISLAARRWFTDTTNGFRAYSSKFLLDPGTAPFRAVFDRYNLLFYLSVRASQLGYPTCEIPVERRYPEEGKTPTKISGLRGRIDMLRELFFVILGRMSPR
jgi:glycosyltransferase involved in cell wall biosynthesis